MDETQIIPETAPVETPEIAPVETPVAPVVLPEPSAPVTPELVNVMMSLEGTTSDPRFTFVSEKVYAVDPTTLLDNERIIEINNRNYVEVSTLEKTYLM